MKIADLPTARKLDLLVAERVLGCEIGYIRVLEGYTYPDGDLSLENAQPCYETVPVIVEHGVPVVFGLDASGEVYKLNVVPRYSEMEHVIEVLLQMRDSIFSVRRRFVDALVEIGKGGGEHAVEPLWGLMLVTPNLAEAICQAALVAVGGTDEDS